MMKIRKILQATVAYLLVLLLWSASFVVPPAMAETILTQMPTQAFSNPNPAEDDRFGYPVAIDGDAVVIGAYNKDAGATDSGEAYLYKASTGELLQTFQNPNPTNSDIFGVSVAIDGDAVAIGTYNKDAGATDSGEAYLYKASTGELLQIFQNPNPADSDYFGRSVAIDEDAVVIGAYNKDAGATDSGEAYLYKASTGELLQTFQNPNPADSDYFGRSVAIDGDAVVIGTNNKDVGATDSGEAYLYKASTGELLQTFQNPNPALVDYFGISVAIDGDAVVIGADRKDAGATNSGEAYLYKASTGELVKIFKNPNPEDYDCFGNSVAIDEDAVVIAAFLKDAGATDSGEAYLYKASTGELLQTFQNPNPSEKDNFGESVAIDGDVVVIGDLYKDAGAENSGAAYLYRTHLVSPQR